jgi:hypothetical protein
MPWRQLGRVQELARHPPASSRAQLPVRPADAPQRRARRTSRRPPRGGRCAPGARGSGASARSPAPRAAGRPPPARQPAQPRQRRPPSGRDHGHALAVVRAAADRRVDGPSCPAQVAPRGRQVDARISRRFSAATARGARVVLRDDHEAGRVLVQPVHDARPQHAADAGQVLTWWSSALTSVPLRWPGAGCTTRPAGLSMTSRSASSCTMSAGWIRPRRLTGRRRHV